MPRVDSRNSLLLKLMMGKQPTSSMEQSLAAVSAGAANQRFMLKQQATQGNITSSNASDLNLL